MSRKTMVNVSEEAKAMDVYAKKRAQQVFAVQEYDKRFLEDGEKYNLHVCMEKARIYQRQMSEGLLGLGVQLILIKNHEEHGNFMTAIEALGLPHRSANYAMNAALKFGNSPTLANLGNSKLKVLTVLDEDQAQDLVNGEAVAGVGNIDDIAQMTVKDLRAALRTEKQKRKEERDAQEAAISQKEQKLNELEMELRYREPPTKEQLAQAKLDEKRKPLFTAIMSGIEDLSVAIDRVWDMCRTEDVQLDQLTRLARSFDSEMSLLKEKLDMLDEAFNTACPIKEDAPCTSSMPNK